MLDGIPIEFNPLIMPAAVTFDVVPLVLVIALVYDKFDGIIDDVVMPPVTCDDGPVVRGCSNSARIRLSCRCPGHANILTVRIFFFLLYFIWTNVCEQLSRAPKFIHFQQSFGFFGFRRPILSVSVKKKKPEKNNCFYELKMRPNLRDC